MNKAAIENFKNSFLFEVIHKEERSDYLWNVIDQAQLIILTKREPHPDISSDNSFWLYIRIISNIERLKSLIAICDDIQLNGFKLQNLVAHEENYYQYVFKHRIDESKKVMKKLRPYILELTKEWTAERKLKESTDPVLGQYFKGWYS